jgi:hypothetical protein
VCESFFIEEANAIQNALRKTELEQALKNAYNSRSKYVHSLSPVPDHLKSSRSSEGDIFHWDKQPYLTFNGLVRLTHHVITNFIAKQEYLVQEEYNCFQDIPGILTYRMAPEYWLGDDQHFSANQSKKWLSGFLENLQTAIVSNEPIIDMGKIIEKIELTIKGVSQEDRITMLVIHKLFCCLTDNCKRYFSLEKLYSCLVSKCHVELMVANLVLGESLSWDLSDFIKNYEAYSKNRFKQHTVHMPRLIEIFLIVSIANMGLEDEQQELYDAWLDAACLEAAGMPTLQNLIRESKAERVKIQLSDLVKSLQQPAQIQG